MVQLHVPRTRLRVVISCSPNADSTCFHTSILAVPYHLNYQGSRMWFQCESYHYCIANKKMNVLKLSWKPCCVSFTHHHSVWHCPVQFVFTALTRIGQIFFTSQLAGEAHQLGVLRLFWIMWVFYIICLYAPQCLSTHCIGGTWIGDTLAKKYKLQLVHEYCNMNKLYKVPDATCICNEN